MQVSLDGSRVLFFQQVVSSAVQQQWCDFSSLVNLDASWGFFSVTFLTNLFLALTLSLLLSEPAS